MGTKFHSKILSFHIVLVWLIIALGMTLRIYRGDEYPINQNDDGLFHVWAGNSIIDDWRQPTSLTIFEAENRNLIWRSQYKKLDSINQFGFRLTNRWFDQPFLATLVIALPSRLFGFTGFSQSPQFLVRTSAFIAALFTFILTYFLSKRLFGTATALIALLILATWPLAVWSSRQSFLENILTPIWLAGLLSLWKYLQTQNPKDLYLTLATNTLSFWTKIIGFMSFIVTGFWVGKTKHRTILSRVILVGLTSIALYLLYGQIVGGNDFWQTLLHQGSRGAYPGGLFHILTHPETFHGIVADGWWFIGFFAIIWLLAKTDAASQFLATNTVFWLVVVVLTSGPSNTSPWYRYPIFPLLTIATASVIKEMLINLQPIWLLFFGMLGLTGWEIAGTNIPSLWLRLGFLILLVVITLEASLHTSFTKILTRVTCIILLTLGVVGNIRAVFILPQRQCPIGQCVRPTRITLPTS